MRSAPMDFRDFDKEIAELAAIMAAELGLTDALDCIRARQPEAEYQLEAAERLGL